MNVYYNEQVNLSNMFKFKLEFYLLYLCIYLWFKNFMVIIVIIKMIDLNC